MHSIICYLNVTLESKNHFLNILNKHQLKARNNDNFAKENVILIKIIYKLIINKRIRKIK